MRTNGFTLAELLIALAILGIIATFTIPKVLNSQQGGQKKAITKEVVAMVSGAFTGYKQGNTVVAGTSMADLIPYMNYVKIDTSAATLDSTPGGGGTIACNFIASSRCIRLHSGAALMIQTDNTFSSTDSTASLLFAIDPDGITTGNADSIAFIITTKGRMISAGDADSTMWTDGVTVSSYGATDPGWFSWN